MACDNGRNPLRWDCRTQGCFNLKKRPKIERLADCLPGRIAFTDVDAMTEICGNLLLLEWKGHQALGTGQRLLFERMTALSPATVLIVEGDAETMTVSSVRTVWRGRMSPPETADLTGLRRAIQAWSAWALAHPAVCQPQGAPRT